MNHRLIVESLESALKHGYPVEVVRKWGSWKKWDYGFVVQVDTHWVVFQNLTNAVYLDGYLLVRIADITNVEDDREAGYVERAVSALGGRPAVDFRLPTGAEVKEALAAAAAYASLISVSLDAEDDGPRMVGRLGRMGEKKFEMSLINPRGVWTTGSSRWRYRDVTTVSFGDRYVTALEQFGDKYLIEP